MKIAICTLGCKVNQYETQAMEAELLRRGHTLSAFEDTADAYIVNTCTVTAVSDKKSRQIVRRAKKEHPGAVVAVCGCYAQTDTEAVEQLGVDLICGTGDRMGFLNLLEQTWNERQRTVSVDDCMKRREFEHLSAGGMEGRTRAMLKVEDGCVNFCSYCVIPYARGPVRSLPLADAVAETERLVTEGYREIVLTGIEISSYGRDLEGDVTLTDLVEAVCNAAPELRVRLGSLEPRTVTEEFCRRMKALPNLCPHFHLSLQSGCDETLGRMNRKYDTARYFQSVSLLRQHFPNPAITTDLIVGFPGETEEEFAATLAFAQQCAFSAMHIFPYSKRPGTPAATMPEQVDKTTKETRAHRAGELAQHMQGQYILSCMGEDMQVLFEEEKDGNWYGHTPNYLEVRACGSNLHNKVCTVTPFAVDGNTVIGILGTVLPGSSLSSLTFG